jgi:hypothetical protein
MECFSSQRDGTLMVIKETTPNRFVVEQTVTTMPGAKTLTLDSKTGKVLLIAAQYGPTPTPPPAAAPAAAPATPPAGGQGGRGGFRGGRAPMVAGSFSVLVVGK